MGCAFRAPSSRAARDAPPRAACRTGVHDGILDASLRSTTRCIPSPTTGRATCPDALARLAADPEAKLLAGGMTLIPSMKHRLAAPSQLIDIARLPELHGISRSGSSLAVGAATRYAEIAADPLVAAATCRRWRRWRMSIGDPQVRIRGTLGGSIANNDPAADFPAAVLALAAVIRTDRREIAADDYFQGMFTTALAPDELICEIRFAIPRRAAYAKFHHPASGYAMTGVFVADFGETVRVARDRRGTGGLSLA